jgi:ADP-dependent NAD(P)H-hydrate dehydratase / NAD(P)H-hydrate epimerase
VLKGAGTLVLGADHHISVCAAGNPGMATAGMGDVLSGVIGSLVAQHLPLEKAAALGVALHASAGDLAANEGERGMIASDLMPFLRRLMNPCGKK